MTMKMVKCMCKHGVDMMVVCMAVAWLKNTFAPRKNYRDEQ